MSAREIRAGRAFVEVTIRDKLGAGLARAQGKLRAFAMSVRATSLALRQGFMAIGRGMTFVGTSIAAAGGSILGIMAKAVTTFLEVSAAAKKAGIAIGGIDPGKAERLQSAWDSLRAAMTAVMFRIGEALAGPLALLAETLTSVAIRVANFVRENQGLVVAIAAVGAVAVVAGGALIALGLTFITLASAIGGVAALLAAILTPAGAGIAIFAALAAAVLLASVAFLTLNETARTALGGIAAMLTGGNFIAAMMTAGQAIHIIWMQTWEAIRATVFGVLDSILRKTSQALTAVELAIELSTGRKAPLGASGVGKFAAGFSSANAGESAAAAARIAAAQAALAGASKQAQDELLKKLGITSKVNFGNFLQGLGGGASGGFGVAGSTSAAAAGFLRAGSVQKVEDKKAHEGLEDVKRAVEAIELSATAEFG